MFPGHPLFPLRPPAAPRLSTAEDELAPLLTEYESILASVHAKGAPRRFLEATHERPARRPHPAFSEQDLAAFLASLDAHLLPAALAGDPGMVRQARHFWEVRLHAFGTFLARFIEETRAETGWVIDPAANEPELRSLEQRIERALLARDRGHLAVFLGRHDVEVADLALALWASHADGWHHLAIARGARREAQALIGRLTAVEPPARPSSAPRRANVLEDRVERSPHACSSAPHEPHAGPSVRPYEAFLVHQSGDAARREHRRRGPIQRGRPGVPGATIDNRR